MGVRRFSLGRGDIARDANWLRPFLPAVGGDTYRVRVSVDDTTPDYLDAKITSTDGSVAIGVLNDAADEDLDLSVSVYVAAEIAGHAANADAHHAQVHVSATTAGLGADHTVSGLTAGQVLRASGPAAAAFAQLQHSDLGGVGANDHHNQQHTLVGSDHTASGLTAGHVLRATGATTFAFAAIQATDLPNHVLATTAGLGGQHTVSGLTAGQVLRATGATTAAFASLQATDLPSHVLATNTALGSQHSISGATAGHVLRASGATTAAFAQLQHSDLGGVGANDHHNQSHVLASTSGLGADHTVSGLTARQVLVATGATTALFRAVEAADLPTGATLSVSSSNSGNSHAITTSSAVSSATAVILATDSNGRVQVQGLGIGMAPTSNALHIAAGISFSGDRTISSGDVSVALNDTFDLILVDAGALRVRRWDDTRYYLNITPTSTNVTVTAYDSTGATNRPLVYVASSHTFNGGDVAVSNSMTVAGDMTITTNGNQGDRFLMTNSNVSGGSVFYDFNQTDRDAGSTGAFELGFYRDANNITQVRMSKEVFEVIIRSGGTYRFPLEVRAQQVILAELPTSNPGIIGALYRSGNDVLIST